MTIINFLAIVPGSIFVYKVFFWVSNFIPETEMEDVVISAHSRLNYYLTVICAISCCFFIDLFIDSCMFIFKPTPSEFLRKLVVEKLSITDP